MEMFRVERDTTIKYIPDPRLDPVWEGGSCYKGHYWIS